MHALRQTDSLVTAALVRRLHNCWFLTTIGKLSETDAMSNTSRLAHAEHLFIKKQAKASLSTEAAFCIVNEVTRLGHKTAAAMAQRQCSKVERAANETKREMTEMQAHCHREIGEKDKERLVRSQLATQLGVQYNTALQMRERSTPVGTKHGAWYRQRLRFRGGARSRARYGWHALS